MADERPEQNADVGESGQDFENMSVEELDAALKENANQAAMADPEPEPEPEPEQEAEVVAEEAEPQEEAEPEAEEEETPEEPTELDIRLAEMRLENEKLRAERERYEFLTGKHAGELGHVKRQLAELKSMANRPREEYSDDEDASPVRPQPSSEYDPYAERLADLEKGELVRGIEEEYNSFLNSHEDSKELDKMQEFLRAEIEPYKEMIASSNVRSARKLVRSALTSAYANAKLEKLRTLSEELKTRRAQQTKRVVKEKAKATISASGSSPAPKAKPKTYADMSIEELDAALKAEYGRYNYRPKRE